MADEENSDDLIDRTTVVAKKYQRYFMMALVTLPLTIGCLSFGVVGVKNIFEIVNKMESEQPVSRFEVFNSNIDETKESVAEQYAVHTRKMERGDIREMNVKFNLIYNIAYENERDFSLLIKQFQSGSYQIASKTRGSGEWFEYFTKDVDVLNENSVDRMSKLIRYTKNAPSN